MTVAQLYTQMDKKIPAELSCDWDNDGLICCPEPEKEVKNILIALDVTDDVVSMAADGGFDLIVSHHPLIFKPIPSLTPYSGVQKKLLKLVENKISVMSFHTRFDALDGGVNDVLANLLGLRDILPFGEDGEEIGRIGYVDEMPLPEFAKAVKKRLGCPCVSFCGKLSVKKVAVLGGSGSDFISAAKKAGADTYISGEIGYHSLGDAKENGINIIEAGHYYTEAPALFALEKMLNSILPNAVTKVICSNTIEVII